MGKQKIPSADELVVFRTLEDLCILVEPNRLGISNEDFFNRPARGLHQKLREAWLLSRLGIALSKAITPATIKVVDGPMLDGIVRFKDGQQWEFEAVTVLRPGRKLGIECRGGQHPVTRISDFSGQVSDPRWPRENILKKVKKAQKQGMLRHLVAYLNYGGAAPDLAELARAIPEAESVFETYWLVTGVQFALLFARCNVGHSLRVWREYWQWLPEECRS